MPQRFFKQPYEIEDYDFDWTSQLVGGDTIASCTVTADPGVDLVGAPTIILDGTMVKQFVGGGSPDVDYKVTCRVTTNLNRSEEADIFILVREI